MSGLTYDYPDGRRALDGVSLEIAPGESTALVGPNGAGKSTLLLHLNGLLPGRRWSGRRSAPAVWIDGLDAAHDAVQVRRKVGLLFQDPDDQLFSTTVLEDVAFGPLNLGLAADEARRLALECLERVDLADAADRAPHRLSFGERKRVCLAGVLACRPSVLALDEPTANLDPRGRRRFLRLIASLAATKVIATHDLEMVLEVCPRTILLDAGRVVADGPSRRILDDETLLEAHGLERPLSLLIGRRDGSAS
nr:ABC transporter ATP-binding protein [Paludisphaera mucosa]